MKIGKNALSTSQISVWKGDFGKSYSDRNTFESVESFQRYYRDRYGMTREEMCEEWLADLPREARILEVGPNLGYQLEALRRVGFKSLVGVEIQPYCVKKAKSMHPDITLIEGSALDIPFKDNYFDCVFSHNVLIHISPESLSTAIDEMVRTTNSYLWIFEYFAEEFEEIHYRDHDDLLWKGDYGKLFVQQYPRLSILKEKIFDYLDDAPLQDKAYLLKK